LLKEVLNQRDLGASSGSQGKLHLHASSLGMNWQH